MDTYIPHRLIQPRAAAHHRRTPGKGSADTVEFCAGVWGDGADEWMGELCVARGAGEQGGG